MECSSGARSPSGEQHVRTGATATRHGSRRARDTRLRELRLAQQSSAAILPHREIEGNVRSANVSTPACSRQAAPSSRIAHKREKQEAAAASSLPSLRFLGEPTAPPATVKFAFQPVCAITGYRLPLSDKSLCFFRTSGSTANKQKQRGGRTEKTEPISRSCAAGRISTAVCRGLQNYFWP